MDYLWVYCKGNKKKPGSWVVRFSLNNRGVYFKEEKRDKDNRLMTTLLTGPNFGNH